MCRFLAYLGEPVFLNELVCAPTHSLVHQSLHAAEAKTETNGDGFGIGWYGEHVEPGLYRDICPAWSDENLVNLCRQVRARTFFAHVRAATGTGWRPWSRLSSVRVPNTPLAVLAESSPSSRWAWKAPWSSPGVPFSPFRTSVTSE